MKREPDFIIGEPNDPYIRRWWIIPRNKFFNIYLHNIRRDDDDRALHDHPWVSMSFVLKGSLFELRKIKNSKGVVHVMRQLKPWRPYFRKAKAAHRLIVGSIRGTDDTPKNVWTLFVTGPRIRDWGFHCPKGWVHWKDFVSKDNQGQVGRGCGET